VLTFVPAAMIWQVGSQASVEHHGPARPPDARLRECPVKQEKTLRLTDACRSLIRPRDVGMRRSPGGVRVRHGAARCGRNCGHAVAARRPEG
jgi:hypothetical protein